MSALLLALSLGAQAAPPPPEQEIRVRLKHAKESVELSGMNLTISPPTAFLEVDAMEGMHSVKISSHKHGVWNIKWDHFSKTVRINSERLWVRGQMVRLGVEDTPFDLELLMTPRRRVDVVAHLDLETYLTGVLPAEMPASWPIEALKAQAVSARSFAIRMSRDRKSKDYDVESTISDQVYKFTEPSTAEWRNRVKRAVEETRGEVLTDKRKHVLKAFFSADCGCQSEDPQFVWGKVDSFQSVKDPSCRKLRPIKWGITLNRQEVREKLVAALNLPVETSLKTMHVGGRTPSGRVSDVVAALDVNGRSQSVVLNSQDFRKIFGFTRVQSTDFSLKWFADELEIKGSGSGHGVGLCQRGAKALAEDGKGYRDILKHYYPRATL